MSDTNPSVDYVNVTSPLGDKVYILDGKGKPVVATKQARREMLTPWLCQRYLQCIAHSRSQVVFAVHGEEGAQSFLCVTATVEGVLIEKVSGAPVESDRRHLVVFPEFDSACLVDTDLINSLVYARRVESLHVLGGSFILRFGKCFDLSFMGGKTAESMEHVLAYSVELWGFLNDPIGPPGKSGEEKGSGVPCRNPPSP